jgi:hypothetical protein
MRQVGKSGRDPGHALLGAEHVFFVGIYSDSNHHAVKQGGGAANYVLVAEG